MSVGQGGSHYVVYNVRIIRVHPRSIFLSFILPLFGQFDAVSDSAADNVAHNLVTLVYLFPPCYDRDAHHERYCHIIDHFL